MYKLLCSTTWFVVLKIVKRMVSFTAMIVTNHCVSICRDEHVKNPDTKFHEIVLYRHRKHQFPVEKCKLHPTRNVDIFCKECKIPICSKCSSMKKHQILEFDDLEEI